MKKKLLLFLWYFVAISSSDQPAPIGPFQNKEQCMIYRTKVESELSNITWPKDGKYTYTFDCWEIGPVRYH